MKLFFYHFRPVYALPSTENVPASNSENGVDTNGENNGDDSRLNSSTASQTPSANNNDNNNNVNNCNIAPSVHNSNDKKHTGGHTSNSVSNAVTSSNTTPTVGRLVRVLNRLKIFGMAIVIVYFADQRMLDPHQLNNQEDVLLYRIVDRNRTRSILTFHLPLS